MKCVNCDSEIKDGSIYCPVCGKEAQMVNGYTSLEDDFLHSLLRKEINLQTDNKKRTPTPEEQLRMRKQKKTITIIVTSLILAIMIGVGVLIKVFVDYKNDNSYEYQINKAQVEMVDHNYESAIEHLARALALVPDDVESRMKMAEIYLIQEEQENAVVLLTEIIRLDAKNKEAFQQLINIYAEKEQYDQIEILAQYAKDDEIKELFKDYLVTKPDIYPDGGIYYNELYVTISSPESCAIYYTMDGTDPVENGKRYIEGTRIELLDSDFYTIRAVCKNKKNIYGDVTTRNYQIILVSKDTEDELVIVPYVTE